MNHLEDMAVFDGADNRKEILILLDRLVHGLSEKQAGLARARFLERLLSYSQTGFQTRHLRSIPLGHTDAYFAFIAITNALGVPITTAVLVLEEEIKKR